MVEADNGPRGACDDGAPVLTSGAEVAEATTAGVPRERIAHRLEDLWSEYRAGRKVLADLEAEQAKLNDTLQRISGAIQILEELLGADDGGDTDVGLPGRVERPAGPPASVGRDPTLVGKGMIGSEA